MVGAMSKLKSLKLGGHLCKIVDTDRVIPLLAVSIITILAGTVLIGALFVLLTTCLLFSEKMRPEGDRCMARATKNGRDM